MRYASDDVAKDDNWWYTANFQQEYYDPQPQKRDIQQFAFYLYALGDMTLNEPSSTGQEGVKIKRMFVYYLGVREAVIEAVYSDSLLSPFSSSAATSRTTGLIDQTASVYPLEVSRPAIFLECNLSCM